LSVQNGAQGIATVGRVRRLFRAPFDLSERRLLLMGLDLASLSVALVASMALRPEYTLEWTLPYRRPLWFLSLGALWFPLAYTFDAYDLRVAGRRRTAVPAVLKAGLVTALMYTIIPFVTLPLPTSRFALGSFTLLVLVLLATGRALYVVVVAQPIFRRRALIVGTGWAASTIARVLREHNDGALQVLGFVADDAATAEDPSGAARGQSLVEGLPVLGRLGNLRSLVVQQHVSALILAASHEESGVLHQELTGHLELGVEIMPMPVLYEQLTRRVAVEHVGADWHVGMLVDPAGTRAIWPLVKRLVDIVLAGVGLLCFAVVLPIVALAIYLESPGPVFYTQERVGKNGKTFRLFKLRTMVPDAEKGGPVWAQTKDGRMTRVGRILRAGHLDEFPQFVNILKGEMSAVGPRPERPEFVRALSEEIPLYRVRHAVRPGMAGWALVQQGYSSSKEGSLLKLQYDLYYVKHQSLWLDFVILLKTVLGSVSLRGR
jgi:exopolysaccharide biosynthesis polyprenyl glycosylphosphotransferase